MSSCVRLLISFCEVFLVTGRLLLSLIITLTVSTACVLSAAIAGSCCVFPGWLCCCLMERRVRSLGDVCTPILHSGPHLPPARGIPSAGTGLVGSVNLLPIILSRSAQPPEELNRMEVNGGICKLELLYKSSRRWECFQLREYFRVCAPPLRR